MAPTARDAKSTAEDIAVNSTEYMAVEGVWNVQLENQALPFGNVGTFQDGKIFIDVTWTANIAQCHRQVAEYISSLSD